MSLMPPMSVAGLFPEIGRQLIVLLRSLAAEEWHLPTLSSRRTVKDIASHLLSGSLLRLSRQRDGYTSPDGAGNYSPTEPLVHYIARMNEDWEAATRRLSPEVLIALFEWADAGVAELFESLDPHAPAIFPVSWAGEQASENWMDVGREYTEKWHHTQQVFDATGRPSTIMSRELFYPCLDAFMRALPFTFLNADAPVGSVVAVHVTSEAGGNWYVERQADGWSQVPEPPRGAASVVTLGPDTAWKILTKRRSRETILKMFNDISIEGDQALGMHVLDMVSVIA